MNKTMIEQIYDWLKFGIFLVGWCVCMWVIFFGDKYTIKNGELRKV